jgi:hypothetical protein
MLAEHHSGMAASDTAPAWASGINPAAATHNTSHARNWRGSCRMDCIKVMTSIMAGSARIETRFG